MTTSIALYTGAAAPDVTLAATAAALDSAARKRRTLLLSIGPAHGSTTLLQATPSTDPVAVDTNLDLLLIDAANDLGQIWDQGRRNAGPLAKLSSDELPLIAGSDLLLGAARLTTLRNQYDQIVIDAGNVDALLRALTLPDVFRWGLRLLFGLDREPGRSPSSVAQALVPIGLIAPTALTDVQEARVDLEKLRVDLFNPNHTTAWYVLHPDQAALETSRIAIPALQLYGLRVAAILCGPLLPTDIHDSRIAALIAAQRATFEQAHQVWTTRPLLPFAYPTPREDQATLQAIGATWRLSPAQQAFAHPPFADQYEGSPAIALDLPGMPTSAVKLTLAGDEMLVRVGSYRRNILLPDRLRGISAIRATRLGDLLIIRQK